MNANEQSPMEANIDRMLSAFFKAELPDPFPATKLPARLELPMPTAARYDQRKTALVNSRLSLAASVAIILGGCWYLSSQMSAPGDRATVGKGEGGSAKIPKEILKAKEDLKKSNMP